MTPTERASLIVAALGGAVTLATDAPKGERVKLSTLVGLLSMLYAQKKKRKVHAPDLPERGDRPSDHARATGKGLPLPWCEHCNLYAPNHDLGCPKRNK